jgi:hypothetical protein
MMMIFKNISIIICLKGTLYYISYIRYLDVFIVYLNNSTDLDQDLSCGWLAADCLPTGLAGGSAGGLELPGSPLAACARARARARTRTRARSRAWTRTRSQTCTLPACTHAWVHARTHMKFHSKSNKCFQSNFPLQKHSWLEFVIAIWKKHNNSFYAQQYKHNK